MVRGGKAVRLEGKKALVTASSSGIGKAIAEALAGDGADVFLSGIEEDILLQTADEIARATGRRVDYAPSDFTKPESVDALAARAMQAFGRIDVLVYNTGGPRPGAFLELSEADWERAYRMILDAAIRLTRRVLPGMVERRFGRLIYMTSSSVVRALPELHLSNVMRAGVQALAESLAVEMAPYGITTHVVAPAHIDTARSRTIAEARARARGLSVEAVLANDLRGIPVGRFGRPEDVARLVAFLASSEAEFMTGQTHVVDGGFTLVTPLHWLESGTSGRA